ncbi:c-type cytochrome [Litchfieldella rifensis]|uniref:C-type cytochrome n=1 Tax=Litchfieldella rifensis TaxID=762643 RepID=A0ABV7LMY8_9GAMM
MRRRYGDRLATLAALAGLLLVGCDQPAMERQPKYETFEVAPGWPSNRSAREPVPGTVARDENLDPLADTLPMALDAALLDRGQQRFDIFCSPCHDRTGHGNGMVVQRGFPPPPTLHSERLRRAPLRYFVDVITDGYGVMYSYRDRVPVKDRWAIAAYIQALQLSQHASVDDLTPAQRAELENAATEGTRQEDSR